MDILVINGDYVLKNSSANLCHLAYIEGLVECGHNVTLLSADGKDYIKDPSMNLPDSVNNVTYYGVSFYEKISMMKKGNASYTKVVTTNIPSKTTYRRKVVGSIKKKILKLYGVHGIYATFVRNAKKFRSDVEYDYVLSLSTPTTSHLLAYKLIKNGHIKTKHWIQVWEDPWFADVYGFNKRKEVFKEEKRLLSVADKICYVSPLTLKKQQELFPESANKMYWQPLPHYYQNAEKNHYDSNTYGYFGDYYSATRNLKPFYEAAKKEDIKLIICGDSNNLFESTDKISIHSRMSLERLKKYEEQTNVLIFLCNLKGGQIPGKIYQYSATDKTILFILDGTEQEKEVLFEYFGKFNRYVFCENTIDSISSAIERIENNELDDIQNKVIEAFLPEKIIRNILNGGKE